MTALKEIKKNAFDHEDTEDTEVIEEIKLNNVSDNANNNDSDDDDDGDDDDDDGDDGDDVEFENNNDELMSMFQHFFTNDDGENIADILTSFKKSLDIQNKLLHKFIQKST